MAELRRVLVVDDDGGVRQVLASTLHVAGYEVQAAEDGADALVLLERWQPDLILLDLKMPRMDGWAFRREQLADDSLAAIPVVLLSGADEAAYAGDRLTVAAVLAKPFDIHEMLAMVYCFAGAAA
jgi:two-component system, chemotaxis family, chemotaxis protein CheY